MTRVLTLKVHLLEPLLAAGLEGDPNAALGLDYIPGAVLRGAAIGRFNQTKSATDACFRRLFLDGTTRFLNGYPAGGNHRFQPCPLSLMKDKHRDVGSDLVQDHANDHSDQNPDVQWQPIHGGSPFVRLASGNGEYIRPERVIHVHTQRDRRKGRATTKAGAVFRYEALAPGQDFLAFAICEDSDVPLQRTLLDGDFCLGGSRTAGYGHVRMTVTGDTDLNTWSEYGGLTIANQTKITDGSLRISFLSDAILRDPETGRHSSSPDVVAKVLSQYLDKPLDPAKCRMFIRQTAVGGFNRRWGLPLPQCVAVARGSLLVCSHVFASQHRLQDLLIHGIGERTAEGFGRVAINWQAGPSFDLKSHARSAMRMPAQEGPGGAELREIESRIRGRRIEERIQSRALQVKSSRKLPSDSRSRLQGLRLAVLNELIRERSEAFTGSELETLLSDLEGRRTVRDKYASIRVDDGPRRNLQILAWIKDSLGRTAGETIDIPDLATGGTTPSTLRGQELYHFRLRTIATALGRLTKESKLQRAGDAQS